MSGLYQTFDFLSSLCLMSQAFYLNNGLNFGDIVQQLAIESQGDRHGTVSTFTDEENKHPARYNGRLNIAQTFTL